MKRDAAQRVLAEAKADQRITASLISSYSRPDGNGYQVHLVLRRGLRVLVARDLKGWQAIKAAWRGL
jgi:hypothetical protein